MLAEKNESIEKAYEKLRMISRDKKKRMEYEAREKAIRDHEQMMKEATERGLKQGRLEGRSEGELLKTIQMTRGALRKGTPLDVLIQIAEEDTGIIEMAAGLIRENSELSDEEILKRISDQ